MALWNESFSLRNSCKLLLAQWFLIPLYIRISISRERLKISMSKSYPRQNVLEFLGLEPLPQYFKNSPGIYNVQPGLRVYFLRISYLLGPSAPGSDGGGLLMRPKRWVSRIASALCVVMSAPHQQGTHKR